MNGGLRATMGRRIAFRLIGLLAVLWAGALAAQGTRIGYVDMKRLLDNAPQVLEARTRLSRRTQTMNSTPTAPASQGRDRSSV